MRFIAHTILFFLFLLPANAAAQVMLYQRDTSIKVFAYGQQRTLAWCGGFNNPQFTMGDLNNDGLQDLVVFEPDNSIRTFINKGVPGNPNYIYAPEYAQNFPHVYDYLILADYNCDGIPDLFEQGNTGFSVYTGYYNAANQLCFSFCKELYYNDPLLGPTAAFNNPSDIPAIVDVDNDGDLDFLSYDPTRGILNFYKNMRVELGLPCDSIQIELADYCWGKFHESYYPAFDLPFDCSSFSVGPSGNTPCLFDYDMDGDYDYLGGNITRNTLTFLLNGRIPYNPSGPDSMVSQDTAWQSGGVSVNLHNWPAAFNVDIDQDGKKDLLISSNLQGENYKCIWYYKNLSTPGLPDWQFQSDTFLIDKTIDLGTAAYPILYDYNKDGKPDLLIGSDGYYQDSSGLLRSRISYYQNTSTPGNPSFTLQTTDFLSIDTFNFQGAAPATGDIDNDSKADLIIGHANGTLSYFKNMAASDAVQPIWKLAELVLTDVDGDTINAGGNAYPIIYDVDKDGKNDLVIGGDGYLRYYQNVGAAPGVIMLKLMNPMLGNAAGSYSAAFIGKTDSSGNDYLLMNGDRGIRQYSGIASGDTTAVYILLDSQYSYVDTGIYGIATSITVGDIAGDGSLYMIVGDNKGGVELYKRGVYYGSNVQVPSVNVNEHGKVTVYPNPANDLLTIQWSGITQPQVQISIINIEGQQLYTATQPGTASQATVPVSTLPDGMYVCVLQSGVTKYYSKFTVVR